MVLSKLKRFIGTKQFYKMVFLVTLPIIIQQVLINVVSLADNVMVGQLEQFEMNGVYIASQIMFVCNLGLFGSVAGSGIFFAQFFGNNDEKNLKYVFKFKCIAALIIAFIFFCIISIFLEPLASLFSDVPSEIEAVKKYMMILRFTLFPFSLSNVCATSFREVKKTSIPMWGSALALLVNISLNYVLIFGKFGFPSLRLEGAAIATVIARLFEFAFLLGMTYLLKMNYIKGLFSFTSFDKELTKKLIKCSIPLFANELFWSISQMIISIALCSKGNDARNALSIATTVNNLFYIGALALGNAIAIIVGNTLGAGQIDKAKKEARQLIFLGFFIGLFFGSALCIFAPLITYAYNISESVRVLAINSMRIYGSLICVFAVNCSCFFAIRAGGDTKIVLLFDTGFGWFVQVPAAIIFGMFTNISFNLLYFIVYATEFIKLAIGLIMIHRDKWANNLVESFE